MKGNEIWLLWFYTSSSQSLTTVQTKKKIFPYPNSNKNKNTKKHIVKKTSLTVLDLLKNKLTPKCKILTSPWDVSN